MNISDDISILDFGDIGSHGDINIINDKQSLSKLSDFALLLGGEKDKDGNGYYWTKSSYRKNFVRVITPNGQGMDYLPDKNLHVGVRPCLPLRYFPKENIKDNNGTKEVEFGEYPQTIVDKETSKSLDEALFYGSIIYTGKEYTTDSTNKLLPNMFKERKHDEFEYDGQKYVRVVATVKPKDEETKLSNGQDVKVGNAYWLRVEPIKWIVNEKKGICVSKDILLAGVKYGKNERDTFFDNQYSSQYLLDFLQNYFAKDIRSQRDYLTDYEVSVKDKIDNLDINRNVILEQQDAIERKKNELENLKEQLIQVKAQEEISDEDLEKIKETIRMQQEKLDDKMIELNGSKQMLDALLNNSNNRRIS